MCTERDLTKYQSIIEDKYKMLKQSYATDKVKMNIIDIKYCSFEKIFKDENISLEQKVQYTHGAVQRLELELYGL